MMLRFTSFVVLLFVCLASMMASATTLAATPSDTTIITHDATDTRHALRTLPSKTDTTSTSISKNNALENDYAEYNRAMSLRGARKLQAQDFGRIITSLGDTPIDQWTGAQWLCLAILLIIISLIFNCLCGGCYRRRYYGGSPYYGSGGYYGGGAPGRGSYYGGGGRCCGSCSDIFWCLCCFEWCCRDCQDVDNCCNAAGNVYQGGEMA